MTTSNYFPDLKVEIAFNAGYSTPAGSRTWTDVSAYVELAQGINITRGRGDEFATTDPNKLTLTLDNRDGRFTAGKAGSPYYPNVKIGRPIKVTSTPVGGTPSIRFLGYVDEWPVEWTGTAAYAMAKISASSRMARLGFGAELRSVVSEAFLRSGPRAYWPMGEPAEATFATDLVAGEKLTLTGSGAAMAFGAESDLVEGSGTAATFADGRYLRADLEPAVSNASAPIVLEAFVSSSSSALSNGTFAELSSGTNVLEIGIVGGEFYAQYENTGPGTGQVFCSPSTTNDGTSTYHLAAALSYSGGTTTLDLYINGVMVETDSNTLPVATMSTVRVGQRMTGSVQHLAVNADIADVANRANAGLNGFADELSGDRIERYAAYADIDPAEVVADTDTSPVAPIDTTGRTVIDNMRTVEQTESGVLFDARDNTLTFHGRARRYNSPSEFTLNVALQEVEAGITPKMDRSALVNDVTATAADGSVAVAVNQDSIDAYGYARESIEIAATSEDAFQAASWKVNTYGEPQARIPSLGVDLLPLTQARQDDLFELDISSKVTLDNLPAQAPDTTLDFFIEGYTETIGEMTYTFDFNVSPTTGYDVFQLDHPVYGVLDGFPIAY